MKDKKFNLTDLEYRVAGQIEADINLEEDPFREIARRAQTDEETVRAVISDLKRRGVIRRFGAVLRHQKAGFTENALVLWAVPPDRIEEAGSLAARRPEVTHCYERTPPFEGIYNLFTMIHSRERPLAEIIKELSSEIGISGYLVLESLEELKKESMRYFQR